MYARGYVTAELMDVPDSAHTALMDRLWKEKNMIRNMDQLAAFYSQFGVDKDKFLSTSRSFAVDGRLRKDQSLVQTYASYDMMFDVVDYLVEQEARSMQQASAAAD
jgi:thiol:disulfide interchange protein DsbA